jgi:hypothetical protein
MCFCNHGNFICINCFVFYLPDGITMWKVIHSGLCFAKHGNFTLGILIISPTFQGLHASDMFNIFPVSLINELDSGFIRSFQYWFILITIMPAVSAACIPKRPSSKTWQRAGSTPIRLAHFRKVSGSGLWRLTSSAETRMVKKWSSPRICRVFQASLRYPPVPTDMGICP